DTGLMVESLDGAPGVYSARFAGDHCSPADNVRLLLHKLEGVENRKAKFQTVIALLTDGKEYLFRGQVEGSIATEPHGEGGFGYDPIFVPAETGIPFAAMSPEDKNAISHRGRAMRNFINFISNTKH
ncbi:MAG: non-canonical purine NTP pyrophosphatase, partial [Muribaculaceae bacterium]|nr:non-canonical purine NTP pyrophosphatase [Muribaculaceae bacterium]